MRKVWILGIGVALLLGAFAVPAVADGEPAWVSTGESHQARAQFGEGPRGVRVFFEENFNSGGYDSMWVRVEAYDYQNFVWCNGVADRSGVDDYYFRNNGAYVDADIQVFCANSETPFILHLEMTWDAPGNPLVDVTATSTYDDADGYKYTHIIKRFSLDVKSVTVEMDLAGFGDVPLMSTATVDLVDQRSTFPHPEDIPWLAW